MKRYQLLLILLSFFTISATAQNLQAIFSFKTFYSPESGPYVETYLSVNANSVKYTLNENGKYQGAIEVGLIFTDGSGVIKHTDKYNLLSPEVTDIANVKFNFLDQQRIQLQNGSYKIELSISDKNVADKVYKSNDVVALEYYGNIAAVSDIQFIDSYSPSATPSIITKSGFDLVPYVDNFYPTDAKSLKFYTEVYNTDQLFSGSSYLVTYFIESAESRLVIENLRGFSKEKAEKVNVLLREIPLGDLPSGNYNLVVEARNQQNEVFAKNSVFFQRSNKVTLPVYTDIKQVDVSNTFASFITNRDTLVEFINSLHPISSSLEQTFLANQLKLADVKLMQQFFYDFWARRSPVNPEKAWIDYRMEVIKANHEFGTPIRRGHATDRGRVYLKYGPPNTISKNYTEPSALPYEIWHYYKLNAQSNRRFVFYNPDLVTNDFKLLHSDAQGEPFNNQWQMVLHSRDTQSRDYDQETKGINYFGNRSDENFTLPK